MFEGQELQAVQVLVLVIWKMKINLTLISSFSDIQELVLVIQ